MVDMDGIARLCFSHKFPGYIIRARGDLTKFWFSANPVRNVMRKCTQYCGISHSVRRVNATKKFDIVRHA